MLLTAIAIAVCPAPPARRYTCVHDGDTIWIQGEKIRIQGIDTPEMKGKCARERQVAVQARDRLVQLLNQRGMAFQRTGKDRYGRTLAKMPQVSATLMREGLAAPWPNRADWCR